MDKRILIGPFSGSISPRRDAHVVQPSRPTILFNSTLLTHIYLARADHFKCNSMPMFNQTIILFNRDAQHTVEDKSANQFDTGSTTIAMHRWHNINRSHCVVVPNDQRWHNIFNDVALSTRMPVGKLCVVGE